MPAEPVSMVSLHTLRRVLALDLRLGAAAIDEIVAEVAADAAVLPLEQVLDILARAEAQAAVAA